MPALKLPRFYFYPRPPRGGRRRVLMIMRPHPHFYPRPPRGGRPFSAAGQAFSGAFLPTPSARRATVHGRQGQGGVPISTHALREEGDVEAVGALFEVDAISTHALREEGDGFMTAKTARCMEISTHALREEGDICWRRCRFQPWISTHALREEGDLATSKSPYAQSIFLPTPSARRATGTLVI